MAKKGLRGSNNPKVQEGLLKRRQSNVLSRVNKVIESGKLAKNRPKSFRKRELADRKVVPSLKTLLNAGYSYKKIAYAFNLAGTPTRRGKRWSAVQVFRVVKRNKLKRSGNTFEKGERVRVR